MKQTYESWVHGHSVLLERLGSPISTNKASALGAYGGHTGDLLGIGDMGGAACFRMGWAARFVVIDLGNGNAPKGGSFWVHYAVPTPAIHSSLRTSASKVFVNYESRNISELSIAKLHVWDGNRRIFADDDVFRSGGGYDGGIPGNVSDSNSKPPNTKELLVRELNNKPIYFGIGISLQISANTARDEFLEIRGVGVEFIAEDRT